MNTQDIPIQRMRNIGIMAHIDAGKTTTSERILYYTKKIHKIGEIDDGTATMDWMTQEQERGITITSAAITTYWKEHLINLIDTPGHVDFTAEVERSLRVLDGAVAVLCAVDGVQSQTVTVWRQADSFCVPRICFINKMDRVGASFSRSVKDIEEKFNVKTLALQLPIGEGEEFSGVIDIIRQKELTWSTEDKGVTILEAPIRESMQEEAKKAKEALIDTVASFNDTLADLYLNGEEISDKQILEAIRAATIKRTYIPCLMGSARHNIGVQPLLDAIVDFLPSPLEVTNKGIKLNVSKKRHHGNAGTLSFNESEKEENSVIVKTDSKEPPLALLFKVQYDKEAGLLSYIRVYSGTIKTGDAIYNISRHLRERVNKVLKMSADKEEIVSRLTAGDIGVIIGLKQSTTGDTLGSEGNQILLEPPSFPVPVISVALESETLEDRKKLIDTLSLLSKEDPTFLYKDDYDTGQLLISGMGELHLDVLTTRIKDDFKIKCKIGSPQVTYRESIEKTISGEDEYSKVIAGKTNTASLTLTLTPIETDECLYECQEKSREIPDFIYEVIESGIQNAFLSGIRLGYPCSKIKATVTKISYNALTDTAPAYEALSNLLFDKLASAASPILLEPVMKTVVTCPKEYIGDAISLLGARGGLIIGEEERDYVHLITAETPMRAMFGFSTSLRSVTKGMASFSMEFLKFTKKEGGFREEGRKF